MPKCGLCGQSDKEMCRNRLPLGPEYYCTDCCPHCNPGFEDTPPTFAELYGVEEDDDDD